MFAISSLRIAILFYYNFLNLFFYPGVADIYIKCYSKNTQGYIMNNGMLKIDGQT